MFIAFAAVWRLWLSDERMILFDEEAEAPSTDAIRRVIELFDRALGEFYSTEIWIDYIFFLQDLIYRNETQQQGDDKMDVDQGGEAFWSAVRDAASSIVSEQFIREKIDSALQIGSYHLRDSHLFWEAYRQFEARVERERGSDETTIIKKLAKLYKRQIGAPSLRTFSPLIFYFFVHCI